MSKKILLCLVLFLLTSIGFSQNLWTKTNQSKLEGKEKVHRSSTPKEFLVYKLNLVINEFISKRELNIVTRHLTEYYQQFLKRHGSIIIFFGQ